MGPNFLLYTNTLEVFVTLKLSNGVVMNELYFLVYDLKVCRTIKYCLKLLLDSWVLCGDFKVLYHL